MNVILLSGGSGKRLWPLSNDVRSKQFIKFIKNGDCYESMIQRVYRQIKNVNKDSSIVIATSKTQKSIIHNQIGKDISISIEPSRKDTFPAIVLAAQYLYEKKSISLEEAVVVCPVDPYVEDDYFVLLEDLYSIAKEDFSNIVLMGVLPTYPSEKYGYIIPEDNNKRSKVKFFKEKPTEEVALNYIQQGGLWNAGVFALKLKYLLEKAHSLINFTDYSDLINKYNSLSPISFDYAVVEKESNMEVIKFNGYWKDIGTWNTFSETMEAQSIGHNIYINECDNVKVVNELDIPIVALGLKNQIIALSSDGLLVSDNALSPKIKNIVDDFNLNNIRFAEKSWGEFVILSKEENSIMIKLVLKPNCHMSYHSHEKRDEKWIVVEGVGIVILDGRSIDVKAGDVIEIKCKVKHTVITKSRMVIFETQIGENIDVLDKQIVPLDLSKEV